MKFNFNYLNVLQSLDLFVTFKGVDETACILLKYKSGAVANLSSNLTTNGENSALIYGDKGTIKVSIARSFNVRRYGENLWSAI